MKRHLFSAFVALFALLSLPAYQVVEIPLPESGNGFTSESGGKLVSVQAFSTNATGTVALKSVYAATVFSNAVAVSSTTATNYVVIASNRIASATRPKAVRVPDGSPSISTNIYTGAVLTNVVYKIVYTNEPNQLVFTNTFAAADYGPFTTSGWAMRNPLDTLLSVTTNEVTTATTNVWSDFVRMLTVTNTLVSGSCTTNVFAGAPASDTYIKAREWLIFEGTATGGFLRLILE